MQYFMTLINFFEPLWGQGRVYPGHVFVPGVANSLNHHLGNRGTAGGSEKEIRK